MSQHTELIARLRGLIGEYWDIGYAEGKNGMANAEAANAKWHDIDAALQALEPTLDAAAALGNLTTKREKVILLSRAQKENELLRAKIATQELRLEDANGLLRYVADQRDAALSKLQALERVLDVETLIDDLSEWSRHVVEDTAHESLEKHVKRVLANHGITPPESKG